MTRLMSVAIAALMTSTTMPALADYPASRTPPPTISRHLLAIPEGLGVPQHDRSRPGDRFWRHDDDDDDGDRPRRPRRPRDDDDDD